MRESENPVSLRELLNKIAELQKQKKDLLDKRRFLLKKRKAISDKIRDRGSIAKSFRGQRDVVVSKVKESKDKRQEVVSKIKENRARLDELKGEMKQLRGLRNANMLKSKIKSMEWSFQTEPREYEKEKKLLKSIEELKDELKSAVRRDGILSEIKKLESENNELRKEQEAFHLAVISKAKESDSAHAELKAVMDTVGSLRKKLEPIDQKLDETRAEITRVSNEISEAKLKVDAIKAKMEEERKGKDKTELKKRLKEVQEKLAKGKKLDTEDILVLQAADADIGT